MKDHRLLQSASTNIFFANAWISYASDGDGLHVYVTHGCPFTKTRLYFTPWVQFRAHQCFSLALSFPPCCRTSKMSPELCFVPSPRMQVTANEHFCASVGCQCPWESEVRVGWPNSIDMSLQKRNPYIEHLTETTNRHISLYAWM